MTPRRTTVSRPSVDLLLLLGAALTLPLSNGRWAVPMLAWLAPALLLRFVERRGAVSGLAVGGAVYLVAYFVMWRGMIPAPGALYFLIAGSYAAAYFLPFVVHRALHRRVPTWASTLVFPLAWVVCEAALDLWTPYGSWISLAYTQRESLWRLQPAAAGGIAAISFLLAWTSAVACAAFDRRRARAARLRLTSGWGVVVALILIGAQLRVRVEPPEVSSVRGAAILADGTLQDAVDEWMDGRIFAPPPAPGELAELRRRAAALNDDLLARSAREAAAGARLIAWAETAGRVLAQDEEELQRRGAALAGEQAVVLLAAYGTWSPGADPPLENKVVAFDERGEKAWEFHKARPIRGPESPLIAAGTGRLPSLDASFGRLTVAICHDMDFPRLLRQASALGAGLVVAPSSDWRAITPFHADMSVARAIENGFTLFRPSDGLSVATDSRGVVLARSDSFRGGADVLVAELPLGHRRTLYSRGGHLLPIACALALVALALRAVRPATVRRDHRIRPS